MSWFNSMMTSITMRETRFTMSKSETTAEIVVTGICGIGGAVVGATIGSILEPVGTAIGMYVGSKAGIEVIQASIKALQGFREDL